MAVLLDCQAHRRRIDDREHLDEVCCKQMKEERFVSVLHRGQERTLGEIVGLLSEEFVRALGLLFDCQDRRRKQSHQAQRPPLLERERSAFVDPRGVQHVKAARRNLDGAGFVKAIKSDGFASGGDHHVPFNGVRGFPRRDPGAGTLGTRCRV